MSDRSLLSTTNSGVGTLTLRTETLIRPKELKHCFSRVLRSSSTTQQQGGESRNSSITQRPDPGDSHYADPGRGPQNSHTSHRQGKGRRGTQALHNDIMGCRGTQALHDKWIPGALTTRIQHAYRGTQALRERNSYVGTLTLRTQILNSRSFLLWSSSTTQQQSPC